MASINELLQNEKSTGKSIFKSYRPLEEISEEFLKAYVKRFIEGKGYPIDEDNDKCGFLSNLIALSTYLEIASTKIDISKQSDIFNFLLSYVFNCIYRDGKIVFDATPYFENNNDLAIDSYIEGVANTFTVMTDLRRFIIDNPMYDYEVKIGDTTIIDSYILLSKVEDLMVTCIKTLNDACLPNKKEFPYTINNIVVKRKNLDPIVKYRGWTYRKPEPGTEDDYDISIYFTYYATNAFINFYNSFLYLYSFLDNSDETKEKKELLEDLIKQTSEVEKEQVKLDVEFYINNMEVLERFRYCTACAGRYIETQMTNNNVDIAFDYISKDFKPVEQSLIKDPLSNYLMNSLFVDAILLNAGIDDDYETKEVNLKDYIYDQLLYSLTNIRKAYSLMKKMNREDFVNSYRLVFDEKYPKSENQFVQVFRKKVSNLSVMEFVPLLCNTYSIVSKFIYQYPQKEMVDNLKYIMENRMEDEWLWSKDGFNVNSNLYHYFALENFYEYFKEFELPYSNNGKKYNSVATEAKEKTEKAVLEREKALSDLKTNEEEKNKEISKLKKEYEEKVSDLDKAVLEIVERVFDKEVEKRVGKYLENMITEGYQMIFEDKKKASIGGEKRTINEDILDNQSVKLLFMISNAINTREFIDGLTIDPTMLKLDDLIKEYEKRINDKILATLRGDNI